MSSNSNTSANSTDAVGREIAYRLFAAEYDDASFSYAESDEERAPNYVITPTGARVNRLFVVGTLTEVTPVNEEMVRARVVDPSGAFVVYAGQYQPEALAFLEQAEPPLFVAVTGKARTFQPDDSEQVYTSIRPESIATVDAETRDRWVVTTAEQTMERVGAYATAAGIDASGDELADVLLENGLEDGLARGIPLAQDHYGTTPDYLAGLRDLTVDAVRVVAGERDEVGSFALAPDGTDGRGATFGDLADAGGLEVDVEVEVEPAVEQDDSETASSPESASVSAVDAETGGGESEAESGSDPASESEPAVTEDETAAASETDGVAESETATDESASVDESAAVAETDADSDSDTDSDDDLEDFDSSGFDDDMYEMDEEERAEIEAEFGTEFTTGAEVDDPGEADIDVPESEGDLESESESESETDDGADEALEAESESDGETETESGGLGDFQTESDGLEDSSEEEESEVEAESESETEAESDDAETAEEDATETETEADEPASDEPAEDVDLQEYVVDTMRELDDGSGAARTNVVETVAEETGADEADVEDAIEDALMGGQCYEPDDETLKPI